MWIVSEVQKSEKNISTKQKKKEKHLRVQSQNGNPERT